jgi:hypothetical protein
MNFPGSRRAVELADTADLRELLVDEAQAIEAKMIQLHSDAGVLLDVFRELRKREALAASRMDTAAFMARAEMLVEKLKPLANHDRIPDHSAN